jgi:hypothetical protein
LTKDENLIFMNKVNPETLDPKESINLNYLYLSESDSERKDNKLALTVCFTEANKNYFTSNFTLEIQNLPDLNNPHHFSGFQPS